MFYAQAQALSNKPNKIEIGQELREELWTDDRGHTMAEAHLRPKGRMR